ncbi:hypothetical protein A0U93_14050 [Neoasaia chiangmaiensis]|uniref:NADH:quinone oxidoreductase/Mrp antiporter membrane subunit domain-containing protein n=1 Tax=Neoasaia chiangmaiensis TaxID=320497 RepID=A0A1U9KSZ2_9PROT|nr:hypothetical protein A0U93_14050 [Neoasaia chiangmaiensis]
MFHSGGAGLSLLLVPGWPLLAACLLLLVPREQRFAAIGSLSIFGLVLTLVLTPLLPGQDLLSIVTRLLVAAVPFLTRREGLSRIAAIVPLLATGCVLAALTLHDLLVVVSLLAFAVALLGLYDAAAAARARAAWNTARLRLSGAILSLLGASFGALPAMAGGAPVARAGDLLLVVGLCLLAGLGPPGNAAVTGRAAWLDMLPRIGALALMLRLPGSDVTHLVFLTAGVGTLWLCVVGRRGGPTLCAGLVTVCAVEAQIVPALLFMIVAMATAAERLEDAARRWLEAPVPPGPAFVGAMALLAGLGSVYPVSAMLFLAASGCQIAQLHVDRAAARRGMRDVVVLGVIGVGLAAPFFLRGSWPLAWHPS